MFIPFSCTMWCDRLIPDIWCWDSHRHIGYLTLTYIHLILDVVTLTDILVTWPWHVYTGTCHASIDTWHTATWYQYTWPDIVTPDWILLHQTPYFFAYSWLSLLRGLDYYTVIRHLVLLNSCTPILLNSCIPEPLKKGDSWYYTPVDPRNRITTNIGLL